ncbi:phosphoethanolamine transferase [Neisseria weaveri]|uniref:phosphoethanolamine transferase n=1 Tax=Neisseria weaveri TaxID=28091 RepID=UPI000D3126AC|nr:sulfatase-like hydrolase/transferase [Neisseria weaveri]
MKKDIFWVAIYTLLLLVSEMAYRFVFNVPELSRPWEAAAIIAVFLVLFYCAKYRLTRFFIALFFGLSTVVNNVHYAVYESWINSTNYLLAVTEITEVAGAGMAMLDKVVPVVLWGVAETLLFISIGRFRRKTGILADGVFAVFFIYMFIRAFTTSNDIGLTPRTNYSRLKSNAFAFSSFIGRTLPYELLELSDLSNYSHPTPQVVSAPKFKNIIFIVGESFSAKHVHHFGYPRESTPFLDSFAQNYPDAVLKPAYAAGLGTAISLPALFNAVPYPNGLTHIVKGDTNLFKLAQQQGFKTSFHSSQPEWEMEILGLMGKKWIDEVTFPTQAGMSVREAMNDHKVLPYLYQSPLRQGQNFIVLHQRGSHVPYGKYLESKQFGGNTPLDNYDSTIWDTDLYIRKVFEFLSKQKTDDWLLIYTSDHGQNVTDEVYNQGTAAEGSYSVPLMIYTPNRTLQQQMSRQFEQCKTMFHQQLSTLLISVMGYGMPVSDCRSGVVNANLLTGNSGYLQVENGKVKFVYPNGKQ